MATIAELILERGRQQGEARRRQGEISGQMWQNLANIAARTGQQIQQERVEAPLRAQEQQLRGLQITQAQGEVDDRQRSIAADAAFRDAILKQAPDDELLKISPERAEKFITGRDAVTRSKITSYNDAQKVLADVTIGLDAVPEDLRPDAYRQKVHELTSAGVIKPGSVPAEFDQGWFKETLAHAKTLNPPKTREIKTRNADGGETVQIVEDKPGFTATSAPERPVTPEAMELEAFAKSLGKKGRADLSFEDFQQFQQSKAGKATAAALDRHKQERDYDVAHPTREVGADQAKLEQNYRTILARAMSSRSGGIGLEDAKVQQANHFLSLLDQTYDPKTDSYNIPKTLQGELSAGLARLVAPGGSVGIEMMREFDQRSAKGDVAGALSYVTGHPFPSAPNDFAKLLKDSIERQGNVAEQNREGEMRYLRGLVPTELEESRRQALEANSLNPLRRSRVIEDDKTKTRRTQTSVDGGKTWK